MQTNDKNQSYVYINKQKNVYIYIYMIEIHNIIYKKKSK